MNEGRRLAIVRTYDELITALRARADELLVTRETMDAVTGLQSGYTAKLLARVPIRQLGRVSLGPILLCLGLTLTVTEDTIASKRIRKELVKRLRPIRASDAMPARKRKRRRGDSEWGKLMKARQVLIQSEEQRSDSARHAARVRWRGKRRSSRKRGVLKGAVSPLSDTTAGQSPRLRERAPGRPRYAGIV
jgi:hypothetical protein